MERSRGHRAGLTRDAVLGAARELLAEHGLAGVTMRTLATRLDVAPNAIYSHVASKDALVDALLDDALADVPVPPVEIDDPIDAVRGIMDSTYHVLLEHPDLVPLYLSRQGARGENAQDLGRLVTSLLREAGIPEPAASEALRVLIVYTIGFAAFTSGLPPGPGTADRPGAAESHATFARGLGWLLAGVR